jgi:beta-glucosidase
VMCSYNRLNGTHTSQDPWLLTTVLREEWGFDGVVVSDWGAVHDRVAALAAGLDLEMPPQLGWSDVAIVDAVRSGDLDEAVLDVAVARMLRLVERATTEARPGTTVDHGAHHALARVAAREGAVLLKNDGAVLPLALSSGETVAVIGELARTPRYQGAGSSQVNPTRLDVPLDELRAAVPDGVEVTFEPGHGAEAVALAGAADVVVLFLGLAPEDESEGFDRSHMDLPAEQVDLVHRVAAVNDHVVVVLANGSAVLTSGWEQDAGAILECWLSGQAAGGAVADLLLGVANPSGRLAETIPVSLEDTTAYLHFPGDSGHVRYGEGLFVGYRGHDARKQAVSYPFGHGLSYTTFAYDAPTLEVAGSHAAGDLVVTLTCRVTNTGDRAGQEVVQLYVADVQASVARPVRELKAFTKLDLAPGESADAVLELTSRDFSFWSETVDDWVLEAGDFVLHVGASSRDLRGSVTVHLDAPRVAAPLGPMSSLEEWLADPGGRAVLAETVGTDQDGRFTGILGDAQMLTIIGNFPMQALAGFGNVPIDRPQLEAMVARVS